MAYPGNEDLPDRFNGWGYDTCLSTWWCCECQTHHDSKCGCPLDEKNSIVGKYCPHCGEEL